MKKIKRFIRKSLIGGILVLLPLVILAFVFRWAFLFVTNQIQPITNYLLRELQVYEIVADIFVIIIIFTICFLVGTIVSTGIGRWLHNQFDQYISRLAPGYRLIKEIIGQVLGDKESSPFAKGEVARVKIFGEHSPTTVTALVTARHDNGMYSVFVPTGPNPTSGNIYHVPESLVICYPEASIEKMMKTVIACGAGSQDLFREKN